MAACTSYMAIRCLGPAVTPWLHTLHVHSLAYFTAASIQTSSTCLLSCSGFKIIRVYKRAGPLPVGPADADDLPAAVLHCTREHRNRFESIPTASGQVRWVCGLLWPGYHTEGLRRKHAKRLKVRIPTLV